MSYYMAFFGSIFGWSEPVLHIAFFLPAILLILGTYRLATFFSAQPLDAALITLFTPVVLISSTTLMCDILMLCFWVWGTYYWITGIRTRNFKQLSIAALLIACSALTKYFGMNLILLLIVWTIAERKRFETSIFFLIIPAIILALYHWYTTMLYGKGLLLDAVTYVSAWNPVIDKSSFTNLLIGIAFTGGCFFTILFFTHRFFNKMTWILNAIFGVIFLLTVLNLNSIGAAKISANGEIRWSYILQFSVCAIIGFNILILTIRDYYQHRDSLSLFLLLWIAGTFIFGVIINWSINGRTLLPMAPALGILIARERASKNKSATRFVPFILSGIMSLVVTYTDYSFANTVREDVSTIVGRYQFSSSSIQFQGHWGFQYYMESLGYKALDIKHPSVSKGDIITYPMNNTNLFRLPEPATEFVDSLTTHSHTWITCMNLRAGAGFYSDSFGPLPFVVGAIPSERYNIHIVRAASLP